MRRVAEDIEDLAPQGALLVVLNNGQRSQAFETSRTLPFPELDGQLAGYPADDDAAIRELERLHAMGAQFVIVPSAFRYWLDTYPGFTAYLATHAMMRIDNERARVYQLP